MILIALGIAVTETLYLHTGTHSCIALLDQADAHMERGEVDDALSLAERADHRFASDADLCDIFMYHSEVTEVRTGLAQLCRYAQARDTSEFLAASARVRRLLQSMEGSRSPRIGNIL